MPGEFVYKPLNLLDLFIVSETIEGKIGEEWEVTCKVIGEKRRGELSRTVSLHFIGPSQNLLSDTSWYLKAQLTKLIALF